MNFVKRSLSPGLHRHGENYLLACVIVVALIYYWFIIKDITDVMNWIRDTDYCGEKSRCYPGDQIFGRLAMMGLVFVGPIQLVAVTFCTLLDTHKEPSNK